MTGTVDARLSVAGLDPIERIEQMVETARGVLGMDMGYVCDTRGGLQAYKVVTGDGDSFGAHAGESVPLLGTYCYELLRGRLENVVRDSAREPLVSELPITHDGRIGSYIGVPIVLSDGRVFGTFCCLSHEPRPGLDAREVELMELLAALIADQIQYDLLRTAAHASELSDGTVGALIASLQVRDGYTEEHSHAVVELAVGIGEHLGLNEDQIADLRIVSVLHDIGKLGIPDAVLHKPGKLRDEEWALMRRHPDIGADLVATMRPISHLAPTIRAEHERWDGNGYPHGLAGEQIPLAARIVLIADSYHAMTSDRPYRKAMRHQDACLELKRNSGTQFWPAGVTAALAILCKLTAPAPSLAAAHESASQHSSSATRAA